MGLTIIMSRPPNFDEIVRVFPQARQKGVIFSYGDKIYSPDSMSVSAPLRSHEAVHGQRQLAYRADQVQTADGRILAWWGKYLSDPQFRLDEEVPAHRAEYRTFCGITKDRNVQASFLTMCAGRLAGPLYNNMVTLSEAKQLILKR